MCFKRALQGKESKTPAHLFILLDNGLVLLKQGLLLLLLKSLLLLLLLLQRLLHVCL
jgi:hypothetical protein